MYELKLPGTPPSLNTTKGQHWARAQKVKKEWEGMIYICLLEEHVPKDISRVQATATLYFTTERRRDEGNYRPVLEKALGDALQLGWLDDDTPDKFRFGDIDFVVNRQQPKSVRTVIRLDVE